MPMNWIVGLVVALVLAPSPDPMVTRSPTPTPTLPAKVLLSVGDSLTEEGDSYRTELSRLMTKTGQPHTWRVAALRGTTCHHWALYLDAAIVANNPQLIFMNCGTNDVPTRDNTEADYRTILATAAARGVPIVASLIGRPYMGSPENVVRPYIDGWMHDTNLAIKRALVSYPGVPVADFQRIPATPEWLQPDGIHWTSWANAGAAQIFYQAAQPTVAGWKTLAQMGTYEMCGLSGAGLGEPWPTNYRVCRS